MQAEGQASKRVLVGHKSRRRFIQTLGVLGAGAAASAGSVRAQPTDQTSAQGTATGPGEVPRRSLGRASAQVSALGVGGHHLGDFESQDEAIRMVHEALDAGITFFDNCWEYTTGKRKTCLAVR